MAEDSTSYTYTCGDKTGFEYYVLGDDIRNEFKFLISTGQDGIIYQLEQMKTNLKNATDNVNAFYFENGSAVKDLNNVYSEIDADVKNIKNSLNTLYNAIMKDIDNVNAELDTNFGYWVGRHLARHESEKK